MHDPRRPSHGLTVDLDVPAPAVDDPRPHPRRLIGSRDPVAGDRPRRHLPRHVPHRDPVHHGARIEHLFDSRQTCCQGVHEGVNPRPLARRRRSLAR